MVASVEEAREANFFGFGEADRLHEAMLIHSAFKLDERDLRDPSKVPDQIRTWLCLLHSTRLFVTFLTGSVFIIHTSEKRPTIRLPKGTCWPTTEETEEILGLACMSGKRSSADGCPNIHRRAVRLQALGLKGDTVEIDFGVAFIATSG